MEISTKMHLLELSTMIHVVRKQIKCILVNERPRDISLARLRDLICRVYQSRIRLILTSDLEWRVTRLRTNQRSQCKIGKTEKKKHRVTSINKT